MTAQEATAAKRLLANAIEKQQRLTEGKKRLGEELLMLKATIRNLEHEIKQSTS